MATDNLERDKAGHFQHCTLQVEMDSASTAARRGRGGRTVRGHKGDWRRRSVSGLDARRARDRALRAESRRSDPQAPPGRRATALVVSASRPHPCSGGGGGGMGCGGEGAQVQSAILAGWLSLHGRERCPQGPASRLGQAAWGPTRTARRARVSRARVAQATLHNILSESVCVGTRLDIQQRARPCPGCVLYWTLASQ